MPGESESSLAASSPTSLANRVRDLAPAWLVAVALVVVFRTPDRWLCVGPEGHLWVVGGLVVMVVVARAIARTRAGAAPTRAWVATIPVLVAATGLIVMTRSFARLFGWGSSDAFDRIPIGIQGYAEETTMRPAIAAAIAAITIGIVVASHVPASTRAARRRGLAAAIALVFAAIGHDVASLWADRLADLRSENANGIETMIVLASIEWCSRGLDAVAIVACGIAALGVANDSSARRLRAIWSATVLAIAIPRAYYESYDPGFAAHRVVEPPGVDLPVSRSRMPSSLSGRFVALDQSGALASAPSGATRRRWSPRTRRNPTEDDLLHVAADRRLGGQDLRALFEGAYAEGYQGLVFAAHLTSDPTLRPSAPPNLRTIPFVGRILPLGTSVHVAVCRAGVRDPSEFDTLRAGSRLESASTAAPGEGDLSLGLRIGDDATVADLVAFVDGRWWDCVTTTARTGAE